MKNIINTTLKTIVVILFLNIISAKIAYSQLCNDVFDFCKVDDSFYNKRSMARSYKIFPSQKIQLIHLFYGSKAYNINICKNDSLGNFEVKIIDYKSKVILWSNEEDKYEQSINISFGSTKRIIIEVKAQSPENFKDQSSCFGVLINYHIDEKKEIEDTTLEEPPM